MAEFVVASYAHVAEVAGNHLLSKDITGLSVMRCVGSQKKIDTKLKMRLVKP